MKLMIFSESFGELTTTFVRNELDYFLNKDVKIQFVALNKGPINYINKNFELKTLCINEFKFISYLRIVLKLNFIKYFNYNIRFSKKINSLINEFKPDALYFHFFNEFLFYYDNLTEQNRKIPITVHFHGYDASRLLVFKSYLQRISEINNKPNVRFVFVSHDMKNRLEEKINSKLNGFVLYYGINKNIFDRIESTNKSINTKLFLQVSSFDKRKGHEFSLISFSKFIKETENPSNYKFLIAGYGNLEQTNSIKKIITNLKLNDNVELLGPVNQLEIKKLFSKVDCFVHNSITCDFDKEGIPIAIMEAMSVGLPIISTIHSGIPELVIHGKSGILVEENNILECANAFEKISKFNNPVEFNIQRIQNVFNIDNYCFDLLNLIFRKI